MTGDGLIRDDLPAHQPKKTNSLREPDHSFVIATLSALQRSFARVHWRYFRLKADRQPVVGCIMGRTTCPTNPACSAVHNASGSCAFTLFTT